MAKKLKLGVLVFELTEACNQSCKFCYNYWRCDNVTTNNTVLPTLSDFSAAKKLLREIYKQAEIDSISFSGGEPMLMPKICDLVLKARLQRSNVNILTNGTLLTHEDLLNFKYLTISNLQIPVLSADPSIHDFITQSPGSHEKCTAALKEWSTIAPESACSVLILTKQNIQNLKETLELHSSLGVRSILVNRFNIGGQGIKYREEMEISHEEIRNSFKTINQFAEEKRDMITVSSGVCTPICILNPSDYPSIQFSFCNTTLNQRPITINHKGDVRFCNHSPKTIGNIFEEKLSDILSSEKNISNYSTIPAFCSKCPYLNICKGGCRAASEQLYGDFSLVDPILAI